MEAVLSPPPRGWYNIQARDEAVTSSLASAIPAKKENPVSENLLCLKEHQLWCREINLAPNALPHCHFRKGRRNHLDWSAASPPSLRLSPLMLSLLYPTSNRARLVLAGRSAAQAPAAKKELDIARHAQSVDSSANSRCQKSGAGVGDSPRGGVHGDRAHRQNVDLG